MGEMALHEYSLKVYKVNAEQESVPLAQKGRVV